MHVRTQQQIAVIDEVATGNGHIFIDALAGAAKTTTMEMAAPHANRDSLALAFNVTIKETLQARMPPHFNVLTMNGLGHRAWQKLMGSNRLKVEKDKMYGLLRAELAKQGFDPKSEEGRAASEILTSLVAGARANGLVPHGNYRSSTKSFVPDTWEGWFALADAYDIDLNERNFELFTGMAKACLLRSIQMSYAGVIDFPDQIYMSCCFGGSFSRYHTVFADEAQDLSPLNHYMLSRVVTQRLIAVGDERQSIYAFRGADPDSIRKLQEQFEPKVFQLTTTFRCAKSIVRNLHWRAPEMQAADWAPEGVVENWDEWALASVPPGAMIVCRNNAPLISLAFKFLAVGVPITMIGGELVRSLASFIKRIAGFNLDLSASGFYVNLDQWLQTEIAESEARNTPSRTDRATDKYEVCRALKGSTVADMLDSLEFIFAQKNGIITLCSGHKSKGLEENEVIHLSPHLIPSRYAQTPKAKLQEDNLKYVIESRPKTRLVRANFDLLDEKN